MTRLRRWLTQWALLRRPQLVRLHAGDVVVIEVTRPLSPTEEFELVRRIEDSLGYRNEVLVLAAGDHLTVLSGDRL